MGNDVRKFFGLLLNKNGYVLEQLFFASQVALHCRSRGAQTSRTGEIQIG
jgi:hypothetical protein